MAALYGASPESLAAVFDGRLFLAAAAAAVAIRLQPDHVEHAVFVGSAADRLPACVEAGENIHLATAIIVKSLDTPLAGYFAILENFGPQLGGINVAHRLCFLGTPKTQAS